MSISLILNKKLYTYVLLIPSFIFLCFIEYSCTNRNSLYDGVWEIESASDVQNLLDMGLVVKLLVNTSSKEMQIWTYINGEGTLQNTGELYAYNDGHYAFRLPDLEPEHYGRSIYGKLTLLDGKLHYSTGIKSDWVFVKK